MCSEYSLWINMIPKLWALLFLCRDRWEQFERTYISGSAIFLWWTPRLPFILVRRIASTLLNVFGRLLWICNPQSVFKLSVLESSLLALLALLATSLSWVIIFLSSLGIYSRFRVSQRKATIKLSGFFLGLTLQPHLLWVLVILGVLPCFLFSSLAAVSIRFTRTFFVG